MESAQAEAAEALEIASAQTTRVASLQQELENAKLHWELDKSHALEELQAEHKIVLDREASLRAEEQKRMDSWIQDLSSGREGVSAAMHGLSGRTSLVTLHRVR